MTSWLWVLAACIGSCLSSQLNMADPLGYGQQQQQHVYGLHLRRAVVFMHAVDRMTHQQISDLLGGHPDRRTVGRIVQEYHATGSVEEPAGKAGLQHSDRKFNLLAWEVLVHLVQEEEQDTLQGVFSVLGCGSCLSLSCPCLEGS